MSHPEASRIRAWARWNNIPCQQSGRISDAVRAAYEAAMHPEATDEGDDVQWVRRGGILVAVQPKTPTCPECGQTVAEES